MAEVISSMIHRRVPILVRPKPVAVFTIFQNPDDPPEPNMEKPFQKPSRCGLGKCHPACLQVFQNIQCFTFFLCIFAVMSGMFPMYLVSQITTIEKHFGLSSQRSGMIVSAGEIGFLICVVFVGHFLNTSHRPRVLAVCAFTIGISSILMTLPYFIFGTPHKHDGTEFVVEDVDDIVCLRNQTQFDLTSKCANESTKGVGHSEEAFGIFIFAAILAGCGATGLWSIGIAYLDDNSGKKESALYIGVMFCLRSIAPVFGLMFGAGVSHISVDLQDQNLSPESSSWIGAWWIGFLGIGVITILAGVPLLFYPKYLPKASNRKFSIKDISDNPRRQRSMSVVEKAAEESKSLAKGFLKSVWKLLKNQVFLAMIIGSMFDVAGGVGYTAFGPKYIETQFHVTTFAANTITAGIVLSSALGLGISGVMTSRLKMRLNDLFLRTIIAEALCVTVFLCLMSFGCPQLEIAGFSTSEANLNKSMGLLPNQTCQFQCNCAEGPYSPVCGSDGVTHFSPCYAGCDSGDKKTGFSDCECVGGNMTAKAGACPSDCNMIIPYAVCMIVINFLVNITLMPFVMVSIRCVDEKDKSLALALINIAISIGILPTPVLYGKLLDSLCLVLEPSKGCKEESDGLCLIYDNEATRINLHVVTFALRFVCPIMYILCWYLSRNMLFAGDEGLAKKEEKKDEKTELNDLNKTYEKEPDAEIVDPDNLKPIIAV